MISYELYRAVDKFLQNVDVKFLLESLRKMVYMFTELSNLLATSSRVPDRDAYLTSLNSLYEDIDSRLREMKVRKVFSEIDSLERSYLNLPFNKLVSNKNNTTHFLNTLTEFSDSYELFLYTQSHPSIFFLLTNAKNFYASLETTLSLLNSISLSISSSEEEEIDSDERALSLVLNPSNELEIIVAKLNSLNIIYDELSRLLNISTAQHPLKIIKVESGSLWAKIFGESKVITLITDLIKDGVSYLHRNYTKEGKLSSIPKRVEEFETIINLETKMKALGYDTSEMRESNQKSAVIISNELNTLLAGEAVVSINEETYSVGSVVDKLIAERLKTPLLEGDTDETKLLGDGESNEENS